MGTRSQGLESNATADACSMIRHAYLHQHVKESVGGRPHRVAGLDATAETALLMPRAGVAGKSQKAAGPCWKASFGGVLLGAWSSRLDPQSLST